MFPHSNFSFNSRPDPSESEIDKWKRKHEEQRQEYEQSEFVVGSLASPRPDYSLTIHSLRLLLLLIRSTVPKVVRCREELFLLSALLCVVSVNTLCVLCASCEIQHSHCIKLMLVDYGLIMCELNLYCQLRTYNIIHIYIHTYM